MIKNMMCLIFFVVDLLQAAEHEANTHHIVIDVPRQSKEAIWAEIQQYNPILYKFSKEYDLKLEDALRYDNLSKNFDIEIEGHNYTSSDLSPQEADQYQRYKLELIKKADEKAAMRLK